MHPLPVGRVPETPAQNNADITTRPATQPKTDAVQDKPQTNEKESTLNPSPVQAEVVQVAAYSAVNDVSTAQPPATGAVATDPQPATEEQGLPGTSDKEAAAAEAVVAENGSENAEAGDKTPGKKESDDLRAEEGHGGAVVAIEDANNNTEDCQNTGGENGVPDEGTEQGEDKNAVNKNDTEEGGTEEGEGGAAGAVPEGEPTTDEGGEGEEAAEESVAAEGENVEGEAERDEEEDEAEDKPFTLDQWLENECEPMKDLSPSDELIGMSPV